jgi:hypothetical protein
MAMQAQNELGGEAPGGEAPGGEPSAGGPERAASFRAYRRQPAAGAALSVYA